MFLPNNKRKEALSVSGSCTLSCPSVWNLSNALTSWPLLYGTRAQTANQVLFRKGVMLAAVVCGMYGLKQSGRGFFWTLCTYAALSHSPIKDSSVPLYFICYYYSVYSYHFKDKHPLKRSCTFLPACSSSFHPALLHPCFALLCSLLLAQLPISAKCEY